MAKPIEIKLKLSKVAQSELQAYLDGLRVSINWLVRELILEELKEERFKYK